MPYPIAARAYLERAKRRLMENTNEAIFYAAFELRCCVEARQEEYATALEFIKTKIKPWKIGETARLLEEVFESARIARVTMTMDQCETFVFYYTPVPEALYKSTERIGDLLHCMRQFKPDDDPFWASTRDQLSKIYEEAWFSCQGKLLTPPLWDHPFKVEEPTERLIKLMSGAEENKIQMALRIEYLEHPPEEWTCDLHQA
jgi:hypothetical protein